MIKMPWDNVTSPSVMLEVTDVCNVNCKVCYKKKANTMKSLTRIRQDLEAAMKLRKLHTVSISGGEPTLHPKLCEIVKMIKENGLHVFLLTNGVLITQEYLQKLKEVGLDFILFHVDIYQKRPDLPENPKFEDVRIRIAELATMAHSYGIDVSMSMTLCDDDEKILSDCSQFFFGFSEITFLFLTRGIDPKKFFLKADSVKKNKKQRPFYDKGKEKIQDIMDFYRKKYDIEPFAFIPATDGKNTVWISYFVPIVYDTQRNVLFKIRSNFVDLWLMKFARFLSGRYIQKPKQDTMVTLLRVFINSMSTVRLHKFVQFAIPLLKPRVRLRHKMIVYDNGPFIGEDGNVVNCKYCSVAVVRDGQVLKCCLADYGRSSS